MHTELDMRRHWIVLVALFFCVFSGYMVTFSGRIWFNDELQMFDVTSSLMEFGDKRYDQALWYAWSNYGLPYEDPPTRYPLVESPIEPAQSYAALPFYWLAETFDLSLVHASWLVNAAAGALVCVVFAMFALHLGYHPAVALIGALGMAFLTALWPYSRTFFREILAMFFLLSSGLAFDLFRMGHGRYRIIFAAGGVLAFWCAVLTKSEILVLLPVMALLLFPAVPPFHSRPIGRWLDYALLGLVLLVFILSYTDVVIRLVPEPINLVGSYQIRPTYFQDALHSYIWSLSGSLWGTSPVLLLAIPGVWLWSRVGGRRYVWTALSLLLVFALSHAAVSGLAWFGGGSLPPRFLLPVLPYIALCILPVIDFLFQRKIARWGVILVGVLVVYSLWWQLTGVLLAWREYPLHLPPEANNLTTWLPSLNRVEFIRPMILTPLLFEQEWNIAWVRNHAYVWPVLFALIAVVFGWMMLKPARWRVNWVLPLGGLVIVMVFLGLRDIRSDAAIYPYDIAQLEDGIDVFKPLERPGDVLFLNNPTYLDYFLQNDPLDEARVVSLQPDPGERGSFVQVPEVVSEDPLQLLAPHKVEIIDAVAQPQYRDSFWVLMETGPFIDWSIRPLEQVLAARYPFIREVQANPPSPYVRFLEYSSVRAPAPGSPPEYPVEVLFEDNIVLDGLSLPRGRDFRPGDVLPVTLHWHAAGTVSADYNVALFLGTEDGIPFVDGEPVQGADTPPVSSFKPTSTWMPGALLLDHRALRLPDGVPVADYYLWVRLYRVAPNGTIQVLPLVSGPTQDGETAILPTRITVETAG